MPLFFWFFFLSITKTTSFWGLLYNPINPIFSISLSLQVFNSSRSLLPFPSPVHLSLSVVNGCVKQHPRSTGTVNVIPVTPAKTHSRSSSSGDVSVDLTKEDTPNSNSNSKVEIVPSTLTSFFFAVFYLSFLGWDRIGPKLAISGFHLYL